jgi:exodeoxyribonuclease V alpha subunit
VTDAALALRATPLLRAFNQAGVLHAADVHVAQRLGALGGEQDERVLLAAALCVRGVRQGSVALRLADVPALVTADDADDAGEPTALPLPGWPEPAGWLSAVQASPLVAGADDPTVLPLRLEHGELWLDRYWRQEVAVADDLLRRAGDPPPVDRAALHDALARLWPGERPDDQREAAAVCVLSRVGVLAGGPGTGKTTTVARLLAALREVGGPRPPRVALAAPTGKAAARLTGSVRGAAAADPVLDAADRALLSGLQATTLHRLLGLRRGTGRAWFDEHNRLPHDVVVVDEASMVSLTLFARLLVAVRPGARLLLVGDPDQLASVEAGAVLDDLVDPARQPDRLGARTPGVAQALREVVPQDAATAREVPASGPARVRDGIALLSVDRRFDADGPIARLARAVRGGRAEEALAVLRDGGGVVRLDEVADDAGVSGAVLDRLRADVLDVGDRIVQAARAGDAATALAALDEHRLLCAHRRGPRGVADWTATVERWWREQLGVLPRRDGRYAGLPLLVTSNDHDNRLYNGDVGVVVEQHGELVAAFDRGDGPGVVPLGRLSEVRPLHAMTVHRSQGSQFARVTVLLPPASSPLGTRQTLYTAVTRASGSVRLLGSAEAVRAAVEQPVARATGLRRRLS